MAGALYQDWENYNPNKPTALRPPSYWYAVKQNLPHALRGLSRVGTNALGLPVDIVNLGLDATDATYNLATGKTGRHLSSDYPFMGSRNFEDAFNIPERTGNPTDFWSEIGGEFLLPTGQGLGRSALKAEELLGRTLKDKLPEFVGKNVPEPFRTPITGLSIKPKDSALSPSLTKEVVSGDKYFRPESLESFNFINPASRETLTYMSPDEFLTLAEKGTDKGKTKKVSELIKSDTKFENLPSIHFTHDGKGMAQVVGHEGRHRMRALKELGVTKVPVRLGSEGKKSIRWGNADEVDHLDYIPPKERPTQIKSEDGDAVLPMFDSDAFPIYSPKEAIVTKQAPKIENLNFNELLTAWTVDQTKVPRKLLSDKLSTPENKNRTIKALNNLGYKDTVPVYRTVRYKGELKDEDLISASLTPEANINFTKFSTEGKTINPFSDNPVPQDFAILRYDVPINDVKGYLPEFAGDIKRTVNKKIKDLGIGQEKISGLKTVTNPSAHAKQLLSTQDEIIADVSKIKPKVLQHYGGNKNLNPLSSELSIPSEIAKGKITKPSDLPSNYSVLPFPKGGINAPKEAWDAWAKNEEIAKKEMIKYYKEFYNIK